MSTVIVTVLCAAGVALAVVIIVRGRDQSRCMMVHDRDGRFGRRVVEQVRQICAVLAAGFCGGFLGFGLGGRLMMRVLGASSPRARGRLTQAGEVVGEVSTGGTVFLVFLLTTLGLAGALALHAFRPLLPSGTLAAGLVVGTIGAGLLIRPSELLHPENRDFDILEPTWLAVILCVATVGVGALTTAVLVDRWVPRWPMPAVSIRGLAGLIPLVVCVAPPIGIAVAFIVAARTALAGRRVGESGRRLGRGLIGVAAAVAGLWITASGLAILT